MRVARRTGAKLIEMDEKIGLTKTVTATATTISAKVNEQTAPVLEKVQQNETVQKVTDATAAAAAAVNQKFAEGFGWVHAKLKEAREGERAGAGHGPAGGGDRGGERRGEGDEGSGRAGAERSAAERNRRGARPFRVRPGGSRRRGRRGDPDRGTPRRHADRATDGAPARRMPNY